VSGAVAVDRPISRESYSARSYIALAQLELERKERLLAAAKHDEDKARTEWSMRRWYGDEYTTEDIKAAEDDARAACRVVDALAVECCELEAAVERLYDELDVGLSSERRGGSVRAAVSRACGALWVARPARARPRERRATRRTARRSAAAGDSDSPGDPSASPPAAGADGRAVTAYGQPAKPPRVVRDHTDNWQRRGRGGWPRALRAWVVGRNSP
jgi:hypothetical protein